MIKEERIKRIQSHIYIYIEKKKKSEYNQISLLYNTIKINFCASKKLLWFKKFRSSAE